MEIHLREIRNSKKLTLRQVEVLTGISKTTLNDIENDKVSPTIYQLEKIAIGLNIKIHDLVTSEYL